MRVQTNWCLSPLLWSFNGVPQGDPVSPLLYSLFTADLPDKLNFSGVKINDEHDIKYLIYADDMVLLSNKPEQLQMALNQLNRYTQANNVTVNTTKTKCMTFYRGRNIAKTFTFNGTV